VDGEGCFLESVRDNDEQSGSNATGS
jgi:hypothetical protein